MKTLLFCHHEDFVKKPCDSVVGLGFTFCGFPKGESSKERAYERQAIFVHTEMTKEEFVSSLRALADSFESGEGLVTDQWERLRGQEINRGICGEEVCKRIDQVQEQRDREDYGTKL